MVVTSARLLQQMLSYLNSYFFFFFFYLSVSWLSSKQRGIKLLAVEAI